MNPGFQLSDMHRRLSNLIRLGTVAEADYDKARVKIKIGPLLTDWLPWINPNASHNRTWNPPEVGEQVVVLSPSGEMSQGVVMHGIYQTQHPAPANQVDVQRLVFQDGSQISYDRRDHQCLWSVTETGGITLKVGRSTLEIDSDKIVLKANKIELN